MSKDVSQNISYKKLKEKISYICSKIKKKLSIKYLRKIRKICIFNYEFFLSIFITFVSKNKQYQKNIIKINFSSIINNGLLILFKIINQKNILIFFFLYNF